MQLSVIICSYNPVDAFFKECLAAAFAANEIEKVREILLIDNNSNPSLASRDYVSAFLSTNANARIIVETQQGLTPARLRGMKESVGDVICFVDDDNIVDKDFFQQVLAVAEKYPFIGSFSGNVTLDFETPPPVWLSRYAGLLVQTVVERDIWSNNADSREIMPCGAGLCIRKEVADHYANIHNQGLRTIKLDRSGDSLMSSGDNDIALCACDIGMGMGLFSALRLRHRIPARRLTKEYIRRLVYGISYSSEVLCYIRGKKIQPRRLTTKVKELVLPFTMRPFDASIYRTGIRGQRDAKKWALQNIPR